MTKSKTSFFQNRGFLQSRLQGIPDAQVRQFRHMLLYLLFPDDVERAFSAGDRKSIAERFANLPRSKINKMTAVELDKTLRQTRADLEQRYGTNQLDYYRPPLRELWRQDLSPLLDNLTVDHVRQAIAEIDQNGVPADARSTTYDLVEGEKRYPPKLVFSLAIKYLTGTALPRTEFSAGEDKSSFRILRNLGLSIVPKALVADLVEAFLAQADAGKELRTSSYPSEYRGLQIRVSFGQGAFSKIPWIAFLTGEQQVSNGIYPVLLYYREARVLILAYGVSETNRPVNSWRDLDDAQTVTEFQHQKLNREPERYGTSYVDTSFDIPDGLDLELLTSRLRSRDRQILDFGRQRRGHRCSHARHSVRTFLFEAASS